MCICFVCIFDFGKEFCCFRMLRLFVSFGELILIDEFKERDKF